MSELQGDERAAVQVLNVPREASPNRLRAERRAWTHPNANALLRIPTPFMASPKALSAETIDPETWSLRDREIPRP